MQAQAWGAHLPDGACCIPVRVKARNACARVNVHGIFNSLASRPRLARISPALQVQLQTLIEQFDADGDGCLAGREAARLLRYVSGGRLVRQRQADAALGRFMAEADLDQDNLISYNVGRGGAGG